MLGADRWSTTKNAWVNMAETQLRPQPISQKVLSKPNMNKSGVQTCAILMNIDLHLPNNSIVGEFEFWTFVLDTNMRSPQISQSVCSPPKKTPKTLLAFLFQTKSNFQPGRTHFLTRPELSFDWTVPGIWDHIGCEGLDEQVGP